MKLPVIKSFVLLVILCITWQGVSQEQGIKQLAVESNHSTLLFSVPISNGITRITGKFNTYDVALDLNEQDFTQSSLVVTIDVNSIDTGIPARDEHLLTADFFDAENFPEITFVSERIAIKDNGYEVHGKFTMRGITKPLTIPLHKTGQDGKNTYGFSSRLAIDRTGYGVGASFQHDSMDNFLGELIQVEIDFWTKKRKSTKSKE
ncbi:MAG: YceI family protein [Aureisphaera sp.]